MAAEQVEMFPGAGESVGTEAINGRCLVRTQDGHRVVIVSGVVLAQYVVGDAMAEANAMVSLVEQGWAEQKDVARVFGCSARSLRRFQRRFEEGGLAALGRVGGYPRGRSRLKSSRARLVTRLKAEGLSNREVARRMGVNEKAVRKALRRLGWTAPAATQESLAIMQSAADPNLSASTPQAPAAAAPAASEGASADPNVSAFGSDADLPFSLDTNPADRSLDRFLAYLGLLDDAAPLFRSGSRVPRAGVLFAVPALLASGVFEVARSLYGEIGPAFYGLRTTLVTVLLMALLRIKRPEDIKEHLPEDLGRLLGLDRAPEVKTLRRKLTRLAAFERGAAFGRELAKRRVTSHGEALGFLYTDGHVRVYHGKHSLPKTHSARMRFPMPATSDYWVNDEKGEPFFVVTAEANAGMVAMLPVVLAEIRNLLGDRRFTIVFDRGGYSPKLFAKLVADGFDILTYRKGRFRRLPRNRFRLRRGRVGVTKVSYLLADQNIRLLGGKLRLRQVTRLTEKTEHQTPILTSRMDLRAVEVAFRMFERWRQENFFKYLREEYALDALVDYQVEPDDPAREVPNPARKKLDKKLAQARADFERLKAEYGSAAFENLKAFKRNQASQMSPLLSAMGQLLKLERQRACCPRRVPVGTVNPGKVIKLATERKHLTNLFKMVAYQAESDLVRLVSPHYKRTDDEGRTLIQSALAGSASIDVSNTELRVTLAPLSSPHRTRAIAALCADLNRAGARFPGTRLRLCYAVENPRGPT